MRLLLIFALTFPLSAQQALPYYRSVPGGLQPGMAVSVTGRVLRNANVFKVDFALGKYEGPDIPFHFNPRFQGQNQVVLNTFKSGGWGEEEICPIPFWKGQHFELSIMVTEAGYQILVNRKQFYVFRHRIPPQRVQFITIAGDLELQSLNVVTKPIIGKMALPYYRSVPGGLLPGMAVSVNGRVLGNANAFKVDFALGKYEGPDIPFHFNPRFQGQNQVVLNTFKSGGWGEEEICPIPFWKGQHFELNIMVTEAGYQILVNRKQFYVFRHRIPPQRVQFITIAGDLELQSLNVMAKPVIRNTALPYYRSVPGGLLPGMAVSVTGRVLGNANVFKVDFALGKYEGPDIPFHFNPRFQGQNQVVLNTFKSGGWGEEEICPIPFWKGQHFELNIMVTEAGYQILVNRKQFYVFRHRIPPQRVQFITIAGDLELQSLNVMAKPVIRNTIVTSLAIYHPAVPYTGNIPGGLGPEKIITVQGSIPKNSIRFEINFRAGQDIPLRISFCMKPWRAVIRNSLLNGNWGKEERSLTFNPLQAGQYFKLTIYCDNREFKVYANGQPFFNYAHRYVSIQYIRTLVINGDVTLSYIKY